MLDTGIDVLDEVIRFIGTLIDRLASQEFVEASALYEPPFRHVHAGGPDEFFAGKNATIVGIFHQLKTLSLELAAG